MPQAFALLPPSMDSVEARAMLLAIGLQESRFLHRKQIGGPAKGFWQFEEGGGVKGVLSHESTSAIAQQVCNARMIPALVTRAYNALEEDDVLACCFARLLLYTLPWALPGPGQNNEGWRQYIAAWRPGKPHRATWDEFYQRAWAEV
jgi:hypothetical protein